MLNATGAPACSLARLLAAHSLGHSLALQESIESTCAKVTKLAPGIFFVSESLRLDGQCLKMQFTVGERGDGTQCVTSLDSSYTPETPKLLAQLDEQSPGPGPAPAPPSSSVRLVNAGLALALAAAPAWLA